MIGVEASAGTCSLTDVRKEKVSQQLRDVKNVQRVQMCVKPKINKSQKGRTNENKTDTSGQGG